MRISLRAYARHRKAEDLPGGTTAAVCKAILTGRLKASVTHDGGIDDIALADKEWFANTGNQGPLTGTTGYRQWSRILARNLRAAAEQAKREAKRNRPSWKVRQRAAGDCMRCTDAATEGTLCAKHAAANREAAANLTRRRREETARRLEGAVQAWEIGKKLGVGSERVLEWAREGLIPFETQGKRGGRKWFRLDDVEVAVGRLSIINGVVYRPGTKRGRSVGVRASERAGETHTCTQCGAGLPVADFPPSAAKRGAFTCRQCRRDAHAIEREQLSDNYVKDQLVKASGLRVADIPPVLVHAHRAHLLVRRAIEKQQQEKR